MTWTIGSHLAVAVAMGLTAAAAQAGPAPFLEFPLAQDMAGASRADAFVWKLSRGDQTSVVVVRAPEFKPETVATAPDTEGQPIALVAISPDGRYVAWQTAENYGGERTYNPADLLVRPQPTIWLAEAKAGAQARKVGPGVVPAFAPDGRLLYRHGADLHAVDTGDAGAGADKVLIPGGAGLHDVVWLKDGRMAFIQDRGGFAFIGLFRAGDDRIDWLVTGPDELGALRVSPDGARIAYLRSPGIGHDKLPDLTASRPVSVDVVDLATRKTRMIWSSAGPAYGTALQDAESALRWDGDDHVLVYAEIDGWARLWSLALGGGAPVAVTPAGCETAESREVGPGRLLVIDNCADLNSRELVDHDLRAGRATRISGQDLVLASLATSGGRYAGFLGGDADTPPLPRVLDLTTGKVIWRQTGADLGWTWRARSPAPVAVTFQAADGVTVRGQLFAARGKGPHPALIYVHGGPPRQMFPAFHYSAYYAGDFAANRALADQGFVVLSVNYRSGIGYGQAFRDDPKRGWRGASEYGDVLAGGQYLTAWTDVDPKRIGIWGGSYGGLLTAQALARNSDLFKAGFAIHGVFDWSWTSDKPGALNASRAFGVNDADRPLAFRSSPVGAIDGWRSPVFLFHGDDDANVDVRETVDLVQRLRAHDVEVRTVIVPGEAHDFVRHATWEMLWGDLSAWFNEKLGR